jgi:hypothetical protein
VGRADPGALGRAAAGDPRAQLVDPPFRMGESDTRATAAPPAPATVAVTVFDTFALDVSWSPVPDAEGYILWTRYGLSDATASWDRLAVLHGEASTTFRNDGLNVGKTYAYKVGVVTSEVGPNVTSWVDATVIPDHLYFYRVFAWNAAAVSDRSNFSLLAVSAFYRHFGLAPADAADRRELPDHLAVELEFLHFLAFKEDPAARAGDPELRPGYVRAQRDFEELHLVPWVGSFADRAQAAGTAPFQAALATLAAEVIGADHAWLAERVAAAG